MRMKWMWVSLAVAAAGCSPMKVDCSASNCPGCCDVDGACLSGSVQSVCGIDGAACQTCSVGSSCVLGACVAPTGGGSGTGGGSATGGGAATGGGSATGGGTANEDGGVFVDAGINTLVLTLDGNSGGFDRAYHGVEQDGRIYVEAYFGQAPLGCPMQSTASSRTLIISNLRPDAGTDYAGGLRVTLFDFDGTITNEPLVRFTETSSTPVDVRPRDEVSFTLNATLDGGVVSGRFTAIHCPALDG
ncbi:MAG: hypothetical protein ACO1OB_28450 [Archangium sp.]